MEGLWIESQPRITRTHRVLFDYNFKTGFSLGRHKGSRGGGRLVSETPRLNSHSLITNRSCHDEVLTSDGDIRNLFEVRTSHTSVVGTNIKSEMR